MCYRKPGPRCSKHAKLALENAQVKFAQTPSEANSKKLAEAINDYKLTPDGIAEMRRNGDDATADVYQQRRDDMINAYHFLEMRNHFGKWGNIPLKEMDSAALTQACYEISEDDSINWESSSANDFRRAINAATYWHIDQKRTNRAGYPKTPYIEHPLRNTLRLHRMGCVSGEVMTASVLHDTVEDCSPKIIHDNTLPPQETRNKAVEVLSRIYGPESTRLVLAVSNPIVDRQLTKEEKRIMYRDHVAAVINDPKVFMVKFVDFKDNAGGLHHNYIQGQEGMVSNMYKKYSMALPVFKENLETIKDHLPVHHPYRVEESLNEIERNLSNLRKALQKDGLLS